MKRTDKPTSHEGKTNKRRRKGSYDAVSTSQHSNKEKDGLKSQTKKKIKDHPLEDVSVNSLDSIIRREHQHIDARVDAKIAKLERVRSLLKDDSTSKLNSIWKANVEAQKKSNEEKKARSLLKKSKIDIDSFGDIFQPGAGVLNDLWSNIIELGFKSDACDWTFQTLLNFSLTCKGAGPFLLNHWWEPVRRAIIDRDVGDVTKTKKYDLITTGKTVTVVTKAQKDELSTIFVKKVDFKKMKMVKIPWAKTGHRFCTYCRSLEEDCRDYSKHINTSHGPFLVQIRRSGNGSKVPLSGIGKPRYDDLYNNPKYNLRELIDEVDELFPDDKEMSVSEKLSKLPYQIQSVKRHSVRLHLSRNSAKKSKEQILSTQWPPIRKMVWERGAMFPHAFGYNRNRGSTSSDDDFHLLGLFLKMDGPEESFQVNTTLATTNSNNTESSKKDKSSQKRSK